MSKSAFKRLEIQTGEKLYYTSDCAKCGSRMLSNGIKDYSCECAYPEDCPNKKLDAKERVK